MSGNHTEPMLRTAPISRLHELFTYDAGTGLLHWRFRRRGVKFEVPAGSLKPNGYVGVCVDRQILQAHRIIFAMVHGYWPACIDHINGDKSDNRLANLREATRSANCWNVGTPRHNSSGVKGVSWSKREQKWRACCNVNKRRHEIGRFPKLDDAVAAVRRFREQHHGEFARHG